MKTNFIANNTIINSIMKNFKYICAVLMIIGTSASAWGTAPTLAELSFSTPIIDENFSNCSTTDQTSTKSENSSISGFGAFDKMYNNSTSNHYKIESTTFGSNALNITMGSGSPCGMAISGKTFGTAGAWRIKTTSAASMQVGIYAAGATSSVYARASASVWVQNASGVISISKNTSSGNWQSVGTYTSNTYIDICVIYNQSGEAATYGNSISLANNTAHVYIDGECVMDNGNPKAFVISGLTLSTFRVYANASSGNVACIDDIKVYNALPTQAGDDITLDKNNSDDGSTSGSGKIIADATSMTINTAPTRTGYTVEGYYTAATSGTKIATRAGALQTGVTVSGNTWTNGSGQWKKGGAATFFTYWTANEYIVEFDKNNSGATGSMEDQEFEYGTAQNLTTCGYSLVGHSFTGWATTDNGAAEYDDGEEVSNLSATDNDIITLYAVWSRNKYKLSVDAPAHVTIKATPEDESDITEGKNAQVDYYATVTLNAVVDDNYTMGGWQIIKDADGTDVTEDYLYDATTMLMPPFAATVKAKMYSDYKFSCAELTLTGPTGDTVFITSTASKSVRSQQAFHLTGSGLTPSTKFSFSFGNSDLNSRFAFKLADGTTDVSTNSSGVIDADIYVVYAPSGSDDGLDIATNLTVTMSGVKPKTAVLNTKTIIGRHLPELFVIAAKRNGKWLALPSNMASTSTPSPVEIAVDDADNPSVAYTATTNMYSLYDQAAGEYIKLAMKGQSDAPLFGSTSTAPIGKSGSAIVTSTLGDGYLWKLVQSRATGLSNAKEAKYTVYSKNNSTNHLRLKENSGNPIWGLYDSGIEELRLIPAQSATVVEAYFVEWGTNGGVIEVDAEGISATKVQAVFDGKTSSKIALSQTKTSGGKDSKYNYTVTFDNSISFSAADAAGKSVLLRWYTSGDVLAGVTSIQVPKIIAATTTMSSINSTKGYWKDLEVHVISDTLIANTASFSNAMTIDHMEIYPGATLKVTAGTGKGTFTTNTLVLRNGWKRFGSKSYDVARVYIDVTKDKEASLAVTTHAYSDWYIDYDQYYPIAVPWDVTVADSISYRYCSVTPSVGDGNNIRLRYYDGAGRAAGTNAGSSNWKDYGKSGNLDVPAKLVPAQGYVMSAKRPTGKAFSIIRMAMTIPSSAWTTEGEQGNVSTTYKNRVSVQENSGSGAWYTKGWNFIANPYMALFNGNDAGITGKLHIQDGGDVKYATIPDVDFKGFSQVNITTAKLKPSSGFLVQVETDGTLEFSKANITPSAPARYTNSPEAIAEQEAYILLSGENGEDQMGLVIGSDYTADYEINADLSKMIGEANIVKTWMRYTDIDMAYVAINEQLAREWIPVTVHIPAEGEYTYSLMNCSTVDELEGLYLVDHETGAVTNLLYNDYTFSAEAGTNTERFAINAIVGERKIPTGADITGVDKNGTEPVKFIWHDKVYILHNNVIYDSTGKRVNVINK